MEAKNALIILGLTVGGFAALRLFRNTTNEANRETNYFDDSKKQATKLFGIFGIVKVGAVATATPIIKDSTKQQLAWITANICDWSVVQSSFTTLCGGNYTVIQAAKTALPTSDYNAWVNVLNLALSRKRIFCVKQTQSFFQYSRDIETAGESFKPGDFVGRLIKEDSKFYYYMSQNNGKEYHCQKDFFKLV